MVEVFVPTIPKILVPLLKVPALVQSPLILIVPLLAVRVPLLFKSTVVIVGDPESVTLAPELTVMPAAKSLAEAVKTNNALNIIFNINPRILFLQLNGNISD